MNEKEISEIRRRFKSDKSNIRSIRGCYVNDNGEIISEFNQPVSLMPEEETEMFLSILKKTLSGTQGKNLIDIEFSTSQVVQSDEHGLLMALRDSSLNDENAVRALFQRIIPSITLEGNYLILLAQDVYDVPYRSRDGERMEDASTDVFAYMLCSICPVKMTKPALSYYAFENKFQTRVADWIVSPPELGFLFPAFDDRSANIYGALYYSRDIADSHENFVNTAFGCAAPMPAATQKEIFQNILRDTMADECSLELVQSVHGHLQQMIEVHKESKEPEPLRVGKSTFTRILKENGVSDIQAESFAKQFDMEFGEDASLSPQNIIDKKQIEVTMPDVKIQVAAGRDDLVETRIIDGARYILIRAEEGVELNGVPILIVQSN